MSYEQLVQNIIDQGFLATPRIIDGFRKTPRAEFLPPKLRNLDDLNEALPIGEDQTTSQPLTVAFMLELLQPTPGNKVLEIGYGSGWQTAILMQITCPTQPPELPTANFSPKKPKCGEIYAYETVPSVAKFGKSNLKSFFTKTILNRIHLKDADFEKDYKENEPYDRIISGAAFQDDIEKIPDSLSVGGRFVFPTQKMDINLIIRSSQNSFSQKVFPGFVFVPITHKNTDSNKQ